MKRMVSLLLCLCLVLTMLPPVAFAAESDADAMKSALLSVKRRIDIPSTYSQFEYQSDTINGELNWEFFWNDSNGGFLSVTADQAGRIIRYQHSVSNASENLPPKMTKDECVSAAKNLLAKTHPEIADKLVFESVTPSRYNNTFEVTFVREEHGIPVTEQSVRVRIDYRTGNCISIYASIVYDAEIKAPGTLVGSDVLFPLWEEMADLTLEYEIDSNSVAELWYTVKGEIRPINAETGEIIPEDVIWEKGESEDSSASGGGGGAANETFRDQLTPEEEEKSLELAGLLSKEKADAIVRSYAALALGKNDSLYSAHLYRDTHAYGAEKEPRSYWNLEYSGPVTKGKNPEHAYACVDAKTGTLLWFRAYRDTAKENRKLSESAAKTTAKALLKVAAADAVGKTDDGLRTDSGKDEIPAEYRFCFRRVENKIPVSNNQITVSVNSVSGKVTEYNRTWTENVTFEDPTAIISADAACDLFVKYQEPKLAYYTQTVYLYDIDSDTETVDWYYSGIPTEKKITLSYLGPDNIRRIDAKNGTVVAYAEIQTKPSGTYLDIKGHFAERDIQLLLDIGILSENQKYFKPNDQVNQLDLLYFIFAAHPRYYTYRIDNKEEVEELYKNAISQGIITEAERNPSKPVTRAEAAKIIVRCAGYETIAKNPEIFRTDYHDPESIPQKDLGYVVVAKALGIMQGSDGKFYGNRVMTRGEAICMICKFLATVR
ncbi:MAG: S-layer homology domain-containing protein [Oscillospiraceae bacterium]|nr:S-layer homology domain-containing protein [Oscillospiraceae bacterium]